MAESGSRRPASSTTASSNIWKLGREMGLTGSQMRDALSLTDKMRQELDEKGLKGFRKGGKVKKTGPAKVHKGEYVVKAAAAKRAGSKKLAQLNRKPPARKPMARKRR
jgi:hypothetical protein